MILNNKIMEVTIKERLDYFLANMKISQRKFENACGLSNGYINNLKKSPSGAVMQKILSAYPYLNQDWLLKGEGNMFISRDEIKEDVKAEEGIPLIPTNAIGGYISGVSDPIKEYDCEKYIIPLFRGADFLIRVDGDSMQPKYMSGDIVACKRIESPTFFQWGRIYVIDSKQGALIKRIEPSDEEGCICLFSENEKYKPFKLHADDINGIALVKGVIRVE